MKVGQTSLVVFFSQVLGSALGFIATLYFARVLGAEVIGIYTLIMTVVAWLLLTADLGVGKALIKRISENEEKGEYLSVGIILTLSIGLFLSIFVLLFRASLEHYISDFDQYISLSVVWFILVILVTGLFYRFILRILKGEHKVHIAGLLGPVQIGVQSLIQIVLVVIGFELLGMLLGYVIGGILIGIIGLYWVTVRPVQPAKKHFRGVIDYAKFSWLGGLKSRTFNDIDIIILGFFVSSSLVGIYAIAWSIAKFLKLFSNAISSALFPEISYKSTQDSNLAATGLIEDSLAYNGLIAIPGLVGSILLSDRLLRLYGPEFIQGSTVLVLLILGIVLYTYLKQFLNALNGLNRPDLAFRINGVFIILNTGLNVILIWQFSIVGAAIASVISVIITLAIAYRFVSQIVSFDTPLGEIGRQCVAALAMGGVVWSGLYGIESTAVIQHNATIVLLLVGIGAAFYFTTLLGISSRFRKTVDRNLPVDLPLI